VNWLDKTIGYLAPEAGLRRVRARAALGVITQSRAYDAARIDRRTSGWKATSTSANAEIGPAFRISRDRSRDLVRNNPYATKALNALVSKSVGTGIRARMDKGAKKVWENWVKSCDFDGHFDLYGIQMLAARAAFESGEVLIRRIRKTSGDVPLQLQVLEPDYLDPTRYGPQANGNYAIAGVEINLQGQVVAYWLYDQHPGENVLLPRSLWSHRVDASEVIHFYEKRRPGQLRGMPRLASSIIKLRDLDEYEEAELVRKKIEACFVAFVHGGNPNTPLGEASTDTSVTPAKRNETLSPGIIEYLGQNEEVSFGSPSSSSGYGDYTKTQLHAIAAGAGVTYELLTGDLSQVNFSSIRAGQNDFRDMIDQWRWIDFIPVVCNRIEAWFMDAAWTAGSIRTRNYTALWTAPKWPYVDPLKDIQAMKEEIRGGLSSLSEKIRQNGDDPQEVFAEKASELKELKALNVVVDSDAAVAVNGRPAIPADTAAAEGDAASASSTSAKP
jgi:lambda family phage portal protein